MYRDSAFDSWKTAVADRADTGITEEEKTFRDTYSSYSLAIVCDILNLEGNTNTASRAGTGCCLRDMSGSVGGGYCMLINST